MPDDTRELIEVGVFLRWLALAAAGVVIAGLAAGVYWSRRSARPLAGLARGGAIAVLGPAALGLWFAYDAIETRYGLDSVRALLINLGLFAVVGVLTGMCLSWIWRKTEPAPQAERTSEE